MGLQMAGLRAKERIIAGPSRLTVILTASPVTRSNQRRFSRYTATA
jgi:hypothetical protein